MIKKILIGSLVATALLFTGCGEDSEGVDKLDAQQMLDNGDFDGVISKVEPTASANSDYLTLAAAYMGKAGLSLPDLIDLIINSDDTGDDAFVTFIDQVNSKKSGSALNDLEKSSQYYKRVVPECSIEANLTDSQKDICLFMGLSQTMKVATAIGYLADDISVLTANNASTDAKLTASLCAMKYAIDGRNSSNVDSVCVVADGMPDITFVDSNRTYSPIEITVKGETFEFLLTNQNSTAITGSFCSTESFSTRIPVDQNVTFDTLSSYDGYNSSYHACPVNETPLVTGDATSETDITTADVIVSALNEGADSIGVAASEDMQQSIDEFKCEVLGGNYNSSCTGANLNDDVTEQQIIDYLNLKN